MSQNKVACSFEIVQMTVHQQMEAHGKLVSHQAAKIGDETLRGSEVSLELRKQPASHAAFCVDNVLFLLDQF